jgi:GNAT superfamily N-acetyltransferase
MTEGTVERVGAVGIGVRRVTVGDRPTVLAVAARAFWNDPLFDFFARDLLHEYRLLPLLLDAYLREIESSRGESWVGEVDGRLRAFAGWVAPDGADRSVRHELVRTVRMLPVVARARHSIKAIRLFMEVDKRHPTEPHWYLGLLVTDPGAQGRGVGTRLLAPVLERCDQEGHFAYLETQKEANVAWYARSGFEVADVVRLEDTPPVWLLRRDPRPR